MNRVLLILISLIFSWPNLLSQNKEFEGVNHDLLKTEIINGKIDETLLAKLESDLENLGDKSIIQVRFWIYGDFGTDFTNTGDSGIRINTCLLYTSPSPRDATLSRMPSSA